MMASELKCVFQRPEIYALKTKHILLQRAMH